MGSVIFNKIIVRPLKRIPVLGGDVLQVLKNTDDSYKNFGEAYFTFINYGAIKAWKKHLKMTLNLVVPFGNVKFIFTDDLGEDIYEIQIGDNNYSMISVPPGIWFGFKGISNTSSIVLNIADILHDPLEVERKKVTDFNIKF